MGIRERIYDYRLNRLARQIAWSDDPSLGEDWPNIPGDLKEEYMERAADVLELRASI